MPFPDVPRVIYEINPLDEVICQLRFPPVLKIDTEVPAGFQEQIRDDYPFYESKSPLRLPTGLPPNVAPTSVAELLGGTKEPRFPFPGQDLELESAARVSGADMPGLRALGDLP